MRKHLYCKTSCFRTWLLAADLLIRHAKSVIGRISCLWSSTPFLTHTSLHHLGGWEASRPSLSAAYFPNKFTCSDQISWVPSVIPIWTNSFDPLYWLSQNLTALGFWICLATLKKCTAVLLETLMAVLESRSHSFNLPRQACREPTRSDGLRDVSTDSRTVRVLLQLGVAGVCRYVVYTQSEKNMGEVQPESPRPAWHNMCSWPTGRKFGTFSAQSVITWFWTDEMGSIGHFTRTGGL
jgi:hypothetical protein